MKFLFLYFSIFICCKASALENTNIIKVYATMIPNTGSFVATSNKAHGRLLKDGSEFKADRLSVSLDSFRTENSLRDKHFIKFLTGESNLPHPRIDIIHLVGKNNIAKANIVINGVSKELNLNYIEKINYVDVTFNLNTRDFKLETPSYLGVTVSEDVKINVNYYWEEK